MSDRKVLVLCSGNSARSQMSEGLINHVLGDTWQAFSAGIRPSGYVHPLAVQVMAEIGIDISHHRSKSVDEFRNASFDVVITVCDRAAQSCPTWLGKGKRVHIGFPDPGVGVDSEEERVQQFRDVRDGIADRVLGFLRSWQGEAESDAGFVVLEDGDS